MTDSSKPARGKPSRLLMLELLDGLSDRGLLARVESVECDGVSLKFSPAPPPAPEQERLRQKPVERDDEDEHGLKYASS